jgi:hypothetical protein
MPDLSADYFEDFHDKDGWARMHCLVAPEGDALRVTLVVEGSSKFSTDYAPFDLLGSGLGHGDCLHESLPLRREYRSRAAIEHTYADWPLVRLALANGWWLYFDLDARRFVEVDRFSIDVPFPRLDVTDETHVGAILQALRQMAAVFLGPSASPTFAQRLQRDEVSSFDMEARTDGQGLWASHVPLQYQPWRGREEIEFGGRCAPEHHASIGMVAASFVPPA